MHCFNLIFSLRFLFLLFSLDVPRQVPGRVGRAFLAHFLDLPGMGRFFGAFLLDAPLQVLVHGISPESVDDALSKARFRIRRLNLV